jgi:hypothetical protein
VDDGPRRQRGDRVLYRAPEAVEIDVAHSASRKRSHCGRVPTVTRTMPASCGRFGSVTDEDAGVAQLGEEAGRLGDAQQD